MYVDLLLGKSRKGTELLPRLKHESVDDILHILAIVAGHPVTFRRIAGSLFPEHHAEIPNTFIVPFSRSLEGELAWELGILSRFSDRINTYLYARDVLERLFLLGEYEKASKAFAAIRATFGDSLWTIDFGVLLAQHISGLVANRQFIESIGSKLNNPNVLVYAAYYSQRVDRSVSAASYEEGIRSALGQLDKTSPAVCCALFTLGFAAFEEYSRLAEVVFGSGVFPIIDRYATFMRVLQTVMSYGRDAPNSPLRKIIGKAATQFDDVRLHSLQQLIEPEAEIARCALSDTLAEATDSYTRGQYDHTLSVTGKGLVSHPNSFEFYELYAKSLLHMGRHIQNPLPSNSVAHEILTDTFNVLDKNAETARSLESLRKASYMLDSMRFGMQLLAFSRECSDAGHEMDYRVLGAVNGVAMTARFASCLRSPSSGSTFLSKLEENYPNNSACLEWHCRRFGWRRPPHAVPREWCSVLSRIEPLPLVGGLLLCFWPSLADGFYALLGVSCEVKPGRAFS